MSFISLMGALEIGLIFALVALGVLISFRILNFPDLTADGSFPSEARWRQPLSAAVMILGCLARLRQLPVRCLAGSQRGLMCV